MAGSHFRGFGKYFTAGKGPFLWGLARVVEFGMKDPRGATSDGTQVYIAYSGRKEALFYDTSPYLTDARLHTRPDVPCPEGSCQEWDPPGLAC